MQVKKTFRPVAVLALAGSVGAANAAIDTTTALAGITDASAAMGVVLGGMITMAALVFGLVKIYGLLKGK